MFLSLGFSLFAQSVPGRVIGSVLQSLQPLRLIRVIRAYVPSTLPEVIAWHEAGAIPSGTAITGVTDALRKANPDADEEELEYLATKAAEEVSTVSAMTTGQRRATVAIDVPAENTSHSATGLHLTQPVPLADWAAVFVDDLEWYAVEEIVHLR